LGTIIHKMLNEDKHLPELWGISRPIYVQGLEKYLRGKGV
jgi:hypothetical protein